MNGLIILGIFFVIVLSFSNGANDNFKGVATLFGSHTTTYWPAVLWATLFTFAGGLCAIFFADQFVQTFSGKGLVPNDLTSDTHFLIIVSASAAMTVYAASWLGMPISTTHALMGGLIGAASGFFSKGLIGLPHFSLLIGVFFIPMLASPLISGVLTGVFFPLTQKLQKKYGLHKKMCLCLGQEVVKVLPQGQAQLAANEKALNAQISLASLPGFSLDTQLRCEERYHGQFLGISVKKIIDSLHFLSAGMVCFARGVNDTPKIAALLLGLAVFEVKVSFFVIALAMVLGGLLFAKKVAYKMSFGMTEMSDDQGLMANAVSTSVILGASSLGLPVSTTHVSCGSLIGLGAVNQSAKWKIISQIVLSWVLTLPLAVIIGMILTYVLVN